MGNQHVDINKFGHLNLRQFRQLLKGKQDREICPKLKKKIRMIVESRMAFGQFLTRPKTKRVTDRAMTIETSRGRRMILILSTSRRFQVSRARLG